MVPRMANDCHQCRAGDLGSTGHPGNLRFAGLPRPLYMEHRGGGFVRRENAMAAWTVSVAAGFKSVDVDVCRLSNGTIGVIHDSSATVKTTGTATRRPARSRRHFAQAAATHRGRLIPASAVAGRTARRCY